ncbi:MAG: protein jag [Clostridia bacterium]|nr:protein jag [Clostridia bacterium]
MIKECIGSGATVEEAHKAALAALNAPETADVHFEIISHGKKKTLGLFGGAPAQVKVYYELPDPKPAKKTEPEKKAEKKPAPQQKKEKAPKPAPQKKEKPAEAAKPVLQPAAPAEPVDDAVSKYLTKVIALMGLPDVTITASKSDKSIAYNVESDGEQGIVIGRRGETLDALQYLARLVSNMAGDDYDRVSVNVGNYREKREISLRSLAKRSASQVLKYGRNVSLEPMNPYERRIIHTAIQEIEGVQSFSVGNDASRRVVISLQEGVEPTHPSKGGYNNRGGRGRYNNRGGRGGYGRRDNAPRDAAPAVTREPKSDLEGLGLYSKVEVDKTDAE